METKLHTKRIKLRRFTHSDFNNMRELESDPEVMKFIPKRVPQSESQTKETLESLILRQKNLYPLGVWAAELISDDTFVGWFMLNKTELEFTEIGFMIPRKHWGQGITTEVARRLIEYGFNELLLPGISARTDSDNHASINTLTKLGFELIEEKNNDKGEPIKIFRLLK